MTDNERTDDPTDDPIALDAEHQAMLDASREKGWPEWAPTFLTQMRRLPDKSEASRVAGVSASTAYRLINRDPEFADAVEKARQIALDRLESAIYLRGLRGTPSRKTVTRRFADGSEETTVHEEVVRSDVLAMFYLKRWRPEYRELSTIKHTGADGGPVRLEVDRVPTAERMLELLRIAAELELPQAMEAIEASSRRVVVDELDDDPPANGGNPNGNGSNGHHPA